MKLKKTVASITAASVLSMNMAFAAPVGGMDINDFAFQSGSTQSHELSVLSHDEMQKTEGEFWPLIAAFTFLGAYSGGVSYLANTSQPNWSEFRSAVFWGGVSGATGAVGGPGWGLAGVVTGSGSYWTSNWNW